MPPKRKETVSKEDFDIFTVEILKKISSLSTCMEKISKDLNEVKSQGSIEILLENVNASPAESASVLPDIASDSPMVNTNLPVWENPRKPVKRSTSQPAISVLATSNRFAPLDLETCSLPDRLDEPEPKILIETARPEVVVNKRPQVVINQFPENETRFNTHLPVTPGTFLENRMQSSQPVPVMPGTRKYNKAHVKDTLILSDSMCNKINRKQLMHNLDAGEENAIIKKFPGATSGDILHYASRHLDKIRPERFIVVCGTNDLPEHWGERLSEWEIATEILKIGQLARNFGVKEIFLSAIINRQGVFYARKLKKVNSILSTACSQQGFYFLDHSEIHSFYHLDEEGLHLNVLGTSILKMNILKCFNTFNPYFNTFLTTYERAF